MPDNRVGETGLVPVSSSHTTVRTVRYTAVSCFTSHDGRMLFSVIHMSNITLTFSFRFRPILFVRSLISEHLILLISIGNIHLLSCCKIQPFNQVSPSDYYNFRISARLLASTMASADFSQQLLAVFNTSVRPPEVRRVTSFPSIRIIYTYCFRSVYGTLSCVADLSTVRA